MFTIINGINSTADIELTKLNIKVDNQDNRLESMINASSKEQTVSLNDLNSSLISEIGAIRVDMEDSSRKLFSTVEESEKRSLEISEDTRKVIAEKLDIFEKQSTKALTDMETTFQASLASLGNTDSALTDSIEDLNESIRRMQSSITSLEGKVDVLLETT